MVFDRLHYIDRLKEAGIDEAVARAHADALREALIETVATKADLNQTAAELNHRIDLLSRDLTIRGAAGLVIIASLLVGLKIFG